jgi:RNA polymerase sigma-70 factor (ECF subfamily)
VADERDEDVVALPPVDVDPVFIDAVEDALSGPELETGDFDPERPMGADPHDFAGLYIRHRSSFAAHARRFLRDPRDVDEVVQEAFLRLFLALPELGTELQALAYCRRTVTNLCIDRYRADKRRPRLVNIETLPANDFADEELDDPVVQAEDAAFVREALSLLTPLHRDALVKREIEEKSLPVIAEELGVPEESVKHLLHRARRALRRHLAKTHLAPGADLDSVSTLSLLAKSAAAGGGRLGVLIVFTVAILVGVKPELPATALTSWPLELLQPVHDVLLPQAPPKPVLVPKRSHVKAQPAPVQLPPASPAPHQDLARAVPKTSATAVTVPTPTAAALAVTTTAPSPTAEATASPRPSSSASPTGSAAPSNEPSASSSPSASQKPSPSPSASPAKARAEVTPTASPSSGFDFDDSSRGGFEFEDPAAAELAP